jgi:methylenetetrahydrofolate dehydrogenase (NADP+)/methenyltetrahydrofolate cyclohydrolase/formyltetrahydrofolate synthetase
MNGRRASLGLQNGSRKGISHMQAQLLLEPTQPFGKALHTLPRSRRYGRLTTASLHSRASAVLALRRLSTSRGALSSFLSPLSTFSIYTRPLPSTQAAYSRNDQHTSFSSTSIAMTAKKIDGTAIAKSIRERLHAEIENTQKTNPRFKPSLKIIQGKILVCA